MGIRLAPLTALVLSLSAAAAAQTTGAQIERDRAALRQSTETVKHDKRMLKQARRSGNANAAAAARARLERDEATHKQIRQKMREDQWRHRREKLEGAVKDIAPR